MNSRKVRVRKSSSGWLVIWKKGIWVSVSTFATFADAHAYIRDQLYGGQDAYGMAC